VGTSIHDLAATTLAQLGRPAPTNMIQSILMRDGYFVGHKFRYDGGHAVCVAASGMVEFYDGDGKLLKSIALEIERKAA
jgi:hypothetical protein